MSRRFFRRYLPHPDRVHKNRFLRVFGKALHQPNLWHLNRHSVSRAFAIGLFWGFIPIPFQMVPAAAFAIRFKANIAIAVALVWITNPFTVGPIYYGTYTVGRLLLGSESANLTNIWKPLFLGSFITGATLATAGYFGVQWFWRWQIGARHRRRNAAR